MVTLGSIFFAQFFLPFLVSSIHHRKLDDANANFYSCLSLESRNQPHIYNIVHNIWSKNYQSILEYSIHNARFNNPNVPKPYLVIVPENKEQVRAAMICCKNSGFETRVRSGGHDYEGLSYISYKPYCLVDLSNLRRIDIDVQGKTAWVEAGATLGELYYNIANKSKTLAFPAGTCPSVGVGGHISGGGQGPLMRKYGLAADNVLDATILNVNGTILDRSGMGEDLFWVIRGGGAASFGVVLSWKLQLVEVPPVVTFFNIARTQKNGATKLVRKWQKLVNEFPKELFLRININPKKNSLGQPSIEATFNSLYLGTRRQLRRLMRRKFPELKLKSRDCEEMSWIDTTIRIDHYRNGSTIQDLLERRDKRPTFYKVKSDYVTKPLSKKALEGLWNVFNSGFGLMIFTPHGGKVSEILEDATPFPHRKGYLYNIQYFAIWLKPNQTVEQTKLDWINGIYNYMGEFVSKPRTAYLNSRDLDLGKTLNGNEKYSEAKNWGEMYFGSNFEKLARVKYSVDPENYFRNEQSIPPLGP
ncbi:tetrahydroberberine oxidase-like [Nicotiana tomentosiformis]|uniref:tetrahydroberberine oxidase-like n=1 Tax=Nicotiana tomentosiformis TaxID=4098 RepID=UPI00051C9239|nr:berberine bridge enzyme-like 18 [Nicotiana tomentosiformis]